MRKSIVIAILLIAGLSLAAWQRDTIVRFALTTALAHTIGDGATIGSLRFSGDHLLVNDLLVTRRLRPVLTARSVDATFSWRDLLPGSAHRFGLRRIAITDAHFTIIRFADGTLTIPLHLQGSNAPLRAPIATPLACDIVIRNSQVTITDDLDHAGQGLKNFNADIAIDSARESKLTASGADAENGRNRLSVRGIISQTRNFTSLDAQIPHLAVRGLLDALIGSSEIRFARGDIDAVDFHAGSFSVSEGVPTDLSYALTADVRNTSISLPWLSKPVTNIAGPVTIVDGIISTPLVAATISGVSVRAGGGIRIGNDSHIALRVDASGDLLRARQALSYLRGLPLTGVADVHLDLRGLLGAPHLSISIRAPSAHYGDFPLENVTANMALENGHIIVSRFDALYHGIPIRARGSLLPGDHLLTELAIHATTTGAHLPYLAQIRPKEPILIDAVVQGTDLRFAGTAFVRDPRGGTVAFAQSWPDGRLRIAPLWIRKGSADLAGGYNQDRPAQTSAAWMLVRGLSISQPPNEPLPGLTLPDAPFAGRLDAAVALRTHRASSALAMRAQLLGGTLGSLASTRISGTASGNLQTLAIDPVVAEFPWGRFVGRGLSHNGQLFLTGQAHANLATFPLPPGSPRVTGQSDGPVTIALDSRGLGVWVPTAQLQGVTVAGVPVTRVSGQVEFLHGTTLVDHLLASAGGGSVSLLGGATGGPMSFVARGIQLASLGSLRPGNASGSVTAFGNVDAANPQTADFTASLSNGRVGGYDISGSAQLVLRGT
ncbi:MAG: AsmA family protein, partial [Vulcanimicrobiaceae bacterium]